MAAVLSLVHVHTNKNTLVPGGNRASSTLMHKQEYFVTGGVLGARRLAVLSAPVLRNMCTRIPGAYMNYTCDRWGAMRGAATLAERLLKLDEMREKSCCVGVLPTEEELVSSSTVSQHNRHTHCSYQPPKKQKHKLSCYPLQQELYSTACFHSKAVAVVVPWIPSPLAWMMDHEESEGLTATRARHKIIFGWG
eukprot:1158262-Pelagomonas_calceolata.AAC.8